MIRNYFIVALRNLRRNLTFSIINILGLTCGLAITSLIVLYVVNELSYDSYHKDSKNIYRIFSTMKFHKSRAEGAQVNAPMGPYLVENFPKVISQTTVSSYKNNCKIIIGEKSFEEEFIYADNNFFQFFTLKFIYGDSKTALIEPFSLILTEKMALKFFGDINPIGEVVKDGNDKLYKVTAVIENVPENSHLKFDILSSFSTQYAFNEGENKINGWGMKYNTYTTFIKLSPDFSPKELSAGLSKIAEVYLSDNPMFKHSFSLQELEKIYLDYGGGGSRSRIILFSVIGFFVLIIACINYMNLNMANSVTRLKEIGMRKVLGAIRKQLIRQLLFESIILSLVSLILALTLAEILLPLFNTILQKNLYFEYVTDWSLSLSFIALALITGFIAGYYPAFYLSAIKPVNALKGKFVFGSKHSFFRNVLIIFQFSITIFLICCSGIIYMQIRHNNTADLGFKKENILTLDLSFKSNNNATTAQLNERHNRTTIQIKNELSKFPEVSNISVASGFPFGNMMAGHYLFEELDGEKTLISYSVDANYIDLLGLKMIEGREFSEQNSNEKNNVIINETFAKQLNWENPIDKTFTYNDDEEKRKLKVIGIIKDFHIKSFHEKIYPIYLEYSDELTYFRSIGMKLNSTNIQEVISKIEDACKDIDMSSEVTTSFLAQSVEDEYMDEYRTGQMFTSFAIIAIIIASMGLYGLALFFCRQKTKEIGIRKVYGSSINEIIGIISKNFIKFIVISALIGIPTAWFYTDKWLQSFVYQVENRWIVFVLATFFTVIISYITILYHSIKTARTNPIDVIRFE
ncbi:MAG: ABC transporter permease [Bacteroidales bacterium]|nr:ABC transporter permease [Bacteroidales bacterium]